MQLAPWCGALAETLGASFDAQAQADWRAAFHGIATAMREAALDTAMLFGD